MRQQLEYVAQKVADKSSGKRDMLIASPRDEEHDEDDKNKYDH